MKMTLLFVLAAMATFAVTAPALAHEAHHVSIEARVLQNELRQARWLEQRDRVHLTAPRFSLIG